jgi:1,2-diacylglycerol 3-alpha-glucosyltransferase
MRIALFTDTFPPQVNGVANTVARYAKALSEMGHTVCVFTVSDRSEAELEDEYGGAFQIKKFPSLPALVYPGLRAGIPFVGVLKAMREFNPDVIHTHTPFAVGWSAVRAARKLCIPLVGTHHTFFDHYLSHVHLDYAWARNLVWKLTVKYYNYCNVVISPTHSLKDGLEEHGLHVPVKLVPNILDTDLYAPPRVRTPAMHKTLVYMGRLSYEKSVDDVLRAMAHVVKRMPNTLLLVIGDGPEREHLEALTAELGIAEQCIFTGFLFGNELIETLGQADVYLTGSKSENMPLALMEAMAVGLPIVAVRSLGLEEMLMHRKNALLTAPGSPLEIADRTIELLENESLRRQYAEASRAMALAYSPNAVMSRVVELYEQASEYASNSRARSGQKT